jgi:hypothetical protein
MEWKMMILNQAASHMPKGLESAGVENVPCFAAVTVTASDDDGLIGVHGQTFTSFLNRNPTVLSLAQARLRDIASRKYFC